ncbi:response regulator transcription factor [Clostridium sp. HMP27]|uniref:response regulator transcription factor n=1 Tax=Clostridium sp. HMP27 TaxID=1487921 RepID=UPI00052CAD6E|nr:response regulator transcription factor [Clostridium sp. HMP27]KGK86992.1 DeoR faimly transcriptional regulator [Clostridium sp. HMP27]
MEKEVVLIVDDDIEIANLIAIYLQNEGYEVIKAENGLRALEVLNSTNVDLILLDIMMPQMDGIQACMKIREEKNMPIIMLSAKTEDMDKILGLTAGADDYIGKPFNPLELIARVKSQLRRYKKFNGSISSVISENIIEIDELSINVDTHQVKVGEREVKLTPREFGILELLARNKGIIFSNEKIYERVWKEEFFKSDNTVMVHIRKLREKLEDDSRNPKYIKTVWGVGYKVENI